MEACLAAIQRGLVALLAASLAILALMRPEPQNRTLFAVLDELRGFHATFAREPSEQALRAQAEAQGEIALSAVEGAMRGKRAPKLKVTSDARPIRPLSSATLARLSDVAAHAQPGAKLSIGVPDVDALASSLSWRMARTERTGPFTLRSVALVPAELSQADVELERDVARLRLESLDTRTDVESLTHRVETLEQRVEFQTKARSKALSKSREALDETRLALDEKTRAHDAAQQGYEDAARRAERPKQASQGTELSELALARVALEQRGEELTFDIPVPLAKREVAVAPLAVTSFPATRAAGLWDEVRNDNADAAIAAVESHFNWHYRGVKLGGVTLAGSWLLELVPCVLPWLLFLLIGRLRRAETSYSPFSSDVPTSAPRIGLNNRFGELVVLVLLPLLAIASDALCIVFIGRVPMLPMAAGVLSLFFGVHAFVKMRDVREQTLSIVRSHSLLPPAVGRNNAA